MESFNITREINSHAVNIPGGDFNIPVKTIETIQTGNQEETADPKDTAKCRGLINPAKLRGTKSV